MRAARGCRVLTPAQVALAWIMARRESGKCARGGCKNNAGDVNSRTGRRFWRCSSCREAQRLEAARRYAVQRRRKAA